MTSAAAGQTMANGAADHAVMRRVNRAVVLDFIRKAETASRATIADATGLAKPTVGLIIDELMQDGLVVESGRGAPGTVGGRPPKLLSFNTRSSYLAGIHVGVRRTTVVIADALGEPLASDTIATPHGSAASAVVAIAKALGKVRGGVGASEPESIATVGVCLPGLVDESGQLLFAPNLGWRDVPVTDMLTEQIGAAVVAYNAAHTALVAETQLGAAVGESNAVLVYAGSGVGAAAIVDGRLMRGTGGIAGEFGHVRVRSDGVQCNCGKYGCLETVASADAVATAWSGGGRRTATAAEIAAAAASGDDSAREVLAAAADELGAASAWLVNLFDPSCLVLAGGLAGAGAAFVEPFRAALARDALRESVERVRVVVSALGQEAEVRGALLLARERASADLRIVTQ